MATMISALRYFFARAKPRSSTLPTPSAASGFVVCHPALSAEPSTDNLLAANHRYTVTGCSWVSVIATACQVAFPHLSAATERLTDMTVVQRQPSVSPARDGNIAIQEELEAARRVNTVEGYDLFIARHPGHALAAQAERERALLLQTR
jgi:hypothetical protein